MSYNQFKIVKLLIILSLFSIACSDEERENIDNVNQAPVVSQQIFDVTENVSNNSSLGFINALDPDNDALTYTFDAASVDFREIISIDASTGEIKVLDSEFFDFETVQNFEVSIKISDDRAITGTTLQFNIIDEEDGPLRNIEKSFISEYHVLLYDIDNPTAVNFKWGSELKLFLDGEITNEDIDLVTAVIDEFNDLFSDGFKISLVNTLEDSNVHLLSGPENITAMIWPDIFSFITQPERSFLGVATSSIDDNLNIKGGRIWLRDINRTILLHEMGHSLGLGHASNEFCTQTPISIMCSSSSNPNFTIFDRNIFKVLYHPNINAGVQFADAEPIITELILNGFVVL